MFGIISIAFALVALIPELKNIIGIDLPYAYIGLGVGLIAFLVRDRLLGLIGIALSLLTILQLK